MAWQDQIVIDPNIIAGKPVIKGTRLAVEFIIELLAQGWTEEDILEPKFRPMKRQFHKVSEVPQKQF